MNQRIQTVKYLIFDFLAALCNWGFFFFYRRGSFDFSMLETKPWFYYELVLIPVFWLIFYYASGYYRNVFKKSRLAELWETIKSTFLGSLGIFLILLMNESFYVELNYMQTFFVFFLMQFLLTYIPRIIITTGTTKKIHKGLLGFNTLVIGGNEKAVKIYEDITNQPQSTGNSIVGFVSVGKQGNEPMHSYSNCLGSLDQVKDIIESNNVEEVIIALEYSEHDQVERILNLLIGSDVIVKAIAGMYEIFTGKVRMSAILGTPLVEISHNLMPAWQENLKQFLDIFLSLIALIILFPFGVFLAIGVKLSSKGPVFYSQPRIGKNGKPFQIYKFRSMFHGAEQNGPELSSENDKRVTPFGKFMRRSRFDEIPNFINVLKGDISLVGPRPEREYFIEKIISRAPQYMQLLKVKPGITSWGQVKYGYAENIEQMIRRMKYDLIYIENMSIYVDLKIMIYTILIILKRKGV